jgi:hypothetical protein
MSNPPLETLYLLVVFVSIIRKRARGNGMRMLETDH